MADKGRGSDSVIRIILCVAVLITIILGMLGVIPRKISIPVSDLCLIAISVWNGVSYVKEGRKKQAVLIFAASVVLAFSLIIYFIML